MKKPKILTDMLSYKESLLFKKSKTGLRGEVEFIVNNKTIFKKRNIVLLRGRVFILEKLFNFICRDISNYNTALKEFEIKNNMTFKNQPEDRIVAVFSCGIGGCNLLYGSVNKPTFEELNLKQPIPFLITNPDEELTPEEQKKYVGKKVIYDNETNEALYNTYNYKRFNSVIPKIGGVSGISDEAYVELEIKIEHRDFKSFFEMDDTPYVKAGPRINEIMLSFGIWNSSINDLDFIEPFSKLSFNNYPLDGDEDDIKFLYRIYI